MSITFTGRHTFSRKIPHPIDANLLKDADISHAAKRLRERYDIKDADDDTLAEIKKLIENKKYYHNRKVSKSRSLCFLHYEGKKIKVIYDTSTKNIITALPLHDLELAKAEKRFADYTIEPPSFEIPQIDLEPFMYPIPDTGNFMDYTV